MKYSEALEKIGAMDGGSEIAEAIKSKFTDMVADYKTVKEKEKSAKAALQAVVVAAGVEGGTDEEQIANLETNIKGLVSQVKNLNEQLKGKDTKLLELQENLKGKDKELLSQAKTILINQAATLTGFNPQVLETLAKDAEIEIKEGKAYVKTDGDEPTLMEEFAKADPTWRQFLPALKPGTKTKIPDGGSSDSPGDPKSGKILKSKLSKYGAHMFPNK